MRLDLEKLEVFVEVARAGSYGAAARKLHVTPSAVSHALKKLQDGIGCELISWRGRKLSLSEKGRDLFRIGERMFDELDEVERRMGAGAVSHHFVLGATIEFGITVLLPRLKPLLDAHPDLRLDFRFTNALEEPLLKDEIDLAVDCQPHSHPALHRIRMFREKYVVVASPAFLKAHPIRTPLDLGHTPVLSLDPDGRWWNNFLQAVEEDERPALNRRMVIDHVRGMILGTLAGYGVSLLPKYAVMDELADGRLVILFAKLSLLEDTFCIYQKITRIGRPANRIVSGFLRGLHLRALGDALGRSD
jgi:DNA-binding transcriptional LysR family regulator